MGHRGWMRHLKFCHWDRTNTRRHIVVPTTDCHRVRLNIPITPLSNFLKVSTNGHMRRTIVPTTVHPAQLFWLSETLFLRVSHFFLVSSNGHIRRTHDGQSYPTVLIVRDHLPKCLQLFPSILLRPSTTRNHTIDCPSCISVMKVTDPSPKVLHIIFYVSHDGHRRCTVIIITVHPAFLSCL